MASRSKLLRSGLVPDRQASSFRQVGKTKKPPRPASQHPPRGRPPDSGPESARSPRGRTSPNLERPIKARAARFYDVFLPQNPRFRRRLFRVTCAIPVMCIAGAHWPWQLIHVNGPSMSPLFNPSYSDANEDAHQDHILVQRGNWFNPNKGKLRRRGEHLPDEILTNFQRGQIVTFYTPHDPTKMAVKRVVGLPGDRIRPLPGYAGGDDGVIVPWNHLWVEGDVNSRDKSLDSNWYGPISQNLVIGRVQAVMSPWWRPRWIDWQSHQWPSLQQGRVEENVVREAAENPDVVERDNAWTNGENQKILDMMRRSPDDVIERWYREPKAKDHYKMFYRNAALVVAASDPESEKHELALQVIEQMEDIFGKPALREGWIKTEDAQHLANQSRAPKEHVIDERSGARESALLAEGALQAQGWTIARDHHGKAVTRTPER